MRNKKNKIFTILLTGTLLFSLIWIMVGCYPKEKTYETETFRYQIFESKGEKFIEIRGLTEKGRQQKNIVIPEEIDGKKVTVYRGHDEAPNVRKIIISYGIRFINSWGFSEGNLFVRNHPDGLKVVYVNCQYEKCAFMGRSFYIASAALESFQQNIANPESYSIANMQYLFNYDDSQNNGVVFIDDLEVGEELEIIPTTPKREGYTFIGWFSEPECQNKIELNGYVKTDEEIVYLYAGWKENK